MAKRKQNGLSSGVPRKKAKNDDTIKQGKPRNKAQSTIENYDIRTIKTGLKDIFREGWREGFTKYFFGESLRATNICELASLLLLHKVNTAIDDGDEVFFTQDGNDLIKECFRQVTIDRIEKPGKPQMPIAFRVEIELKEQFNGWPSYTLMGNMFVYMHNLYITNLKNNLEMHCEIRLLYFLRMKRYQLNQNEHAQFDEIDIRNALKMLMLGQDWTGGDLNRVNKMERLYNEVIDICGPLFGKRGNMTYIVKRHWFASMWMFCQIQRAIEEFQLLKIWSMPDFPTVHPFTVVPLHSPKLKHVDFEHSDMLALVSRMDIAPKEFGRSREGGLTKETKAYYNEHRQELWGLIFNMEYINQLGGPHKHFHFHIRTDSVSMSLLYEQAKPEEVKDANQKNNEYMKAIKEKLVNNEYKYQTGIDPGMKCYMACVRHETETGHEENIKISPKQYHWRTEQTKRERKGERLTGEFTKKDRLDREQYPIMPSPRGIHWKSYIRHRATMRNERIAVFATRRYARLSFDKYIQSQRVCDKMAIAITRNMPTLIFMGGAQMAPNSPIGIKKNKRCPGTRKIVKSVKKLGHSDIVYVKEDFTSQTCAICFRRFPRETRQHRFKICRNCVPAAGAVCPAKIVTQRGRKWLRSNRQLLNRLIEQNQVDMEAVQQYQQATGRLLSKIHVIWKNWPVVNPVDGDIGNAVAEQQGLTIVWHRDIVAAKCIMLKGRCMLLNLPIPDTLMDVNRPPNQRRQRPPVAPDPNVQ